MMNVPGKCHDICQEELMCVPCKCPHIAEVDLRSKPDKRPDIYQLSFCNLFDILISLLFQNGSLPKQEVSEIGKFTKKGNHSIQLFIKLFVVYI